MLTYDVILAHKWQNFYGFLIIWAKVKKIDPFNGFFSQKVYIKGCSEQLLEYFA